MVRLKVVLLGSWRQGGKDISTTAVTIDDNSELTGRVSEAEVLAAEARRALADAHWAVSEARTRRRLHQGHWGALSAAA